MVLDFNGAIPQTLQASAFGSSPRILARKSCALWPASIFPEVR